MPVQRDRARPGVCARVMVEPVAIFGGFLSQGENEPMPIAATSSISSMKKA